MPKLTVLEELDSAIRIAATDAEPGQTSRGIAAEFCQSYPELIKPFVEEWAIAKVATLIARYRLKARREHDIQYQLGFSHLPRMIELRSGRMIPRGQATIHAFRDLATQLRKQKGPALRAAENAIALMAKYTPKKKRITWAEVLQREAQHLKPSVLRASASLPPPLQL